MKKEIVSVVFDRKRNLDKKGEGKVEICIYFNRIERKFITIKTCSSLLWQKYQKSKELKMELKMYQQLVDSMIRNNEDLTIENLNRHLGLDNSRKEEIEIKMKQHSVTEFIDFMREQVSKEKLAGKSLARKKVTMSAMERFGRLLRFSDLTDKNVKAFDEFLREEAPGTGFGEIGLPNV